MLSFQDCDLVLLNYNRTSCTQQAINYHETLPWKRILVVDQQSFRNNADIEPISAIDDRVAYWVPEYSTGSIARVIGPEMAKSTIVCTHDDEYLVTEQAWLKLFAKWNNRSIVAYSPTPEFSASAWLADMREMPLELRDASGCVDLGYGAIYNNEWAVWSHIKMSSAGYSDQCLDSSDKAWTTFWGDSIRLPTEGVRRLLMPDFTYADNTQQVTECKECQVKQRSAIKAAIKARYDLFKSGTPAAHWFPIE